MAKITLHPKPVIYRFAGLRIASAFPLSGLEMCRDEVTAGYQVAIRCRTISEQAISSTARISDGQYSGTYNGSDLFFDVPGIGRFLLRAGEEILIELASSSNEDDVRAFLLGVAFGVLCHQRGIAPLHASAIDFAGGSIVFVGASGAGKSTMIAALGKRGHEIMGDDECFLQLDAHGQVQAWPGISNVRLWEDASAALGFKSVRTAREIQGCNKYVVPVRPPRNPTQSRPLHQVYQLHRISTGPPQVIRLRGADALEVLMQNLYPVGIASRLGYQSRLFGICAAAVSDVPVFRFSRPWNLTALDQGIELLEASMRDRALEFG